MAQEGVMDLSRQLRAQCAPGSAAVIQEWCLAGVMLLVIPALTIAGSGPSLFHCSHKGDCNEPMGWMHSKISWARDNLYKMLVQCLAQWRSNLVWGCRCKPDLNNSLDYEFVGICESVLSRDGFTFLVTCPVSQDWEDSKDLSQWSLISDHRCQLHHLPSSAK